MLDSAVSWASQVLQELTQQFHNASCEPYKELAPCGNQLVEKLYIIASCSAVSSGYETSLFDLVNQAHQQLRVHQHTHVAFSWRRLYTDASLLWSLLDIIFNQDASEKFWEESISRLDYAIIVAGAPGEGRLDLVLDAIEQIQRAHLPRQCSECEVSISQKTLADQQELPKLPSSHLAIPWLSTAPSLAAFQSKYSRAPFILRGFALDWPAVTDHPWSSKSYLNRISGRGRVVPVEVGSDYRTDDWTPKIMHWDTFLDYLVPDKVLDSSETLEEVIYLAQHDLLKQFPRLRSDIIIPDYVYASLHPPAHLAQYKPPGNDDGMVVNAWLGPKGTVSPAHTDPFFNIYAQVVGRKTVWLAPPHLSGAMAPYSGDASSATTASTHPKEGPHNPAANQVNPALSNTSRLDVFADHLSGGSNGTHEDMRFMEDVVPHAMSATLEPGDLLFFPPGWWHAMRSEGTSFSVSIWF